QPAPSVLGGRLRMALDTQRRADLEDRRVQVGARQQNGVGRQAECVMVSDEGLLSQQRHCVMPSTFVGVPHLHHPYLGTRRSVRLAAEGVGEQLSAVTDPEHRDAAFYLKLDPLDRKSVV